ncbi:hypothetical protein XELAEV_18017658mg [Xenopus laevis]|uniref:Uncharacterized protein n=1 Tax=Xenopus laevis TaxID=8355 RepID=A0A974DBZ0_XENLA|nr:hypothetical protein XELAEV_18017658mg [Xenopus laevis]
MWQMLKYVVKQVSIMKQWLKNTCRLFKTILFNAVFEPSTYSHQSSSATFVSSLQDEHQERMTFWKEMLEFDFQCRLLFDKLSSFHVLNLNEQFAAHTNFMLSVKLSYAIDGNLMKCGELLQKLQKLKAFGYQAVPGTPIFRNVVLDILCYRQELMNAAQEMEFLWKEMYEQEKVLLEMAECTQEGYQDFLFENCKMCGNLQSWNRQKYRKSLSCPFPNFLHKQLKTAEHSQKTHSTHRVVMNATDKTVLSESLSLRFFHDQCLEPLKAESSKMHDLNHKINPWLRLPSADFTTSSRGKRVSLQPLAKVNKFLKDTSIQTQDKEEGKIDLSTSSHSNSKEMQDKYCGLQECGVQTELSFRPIGLFSTTSLLESNDSFLSSYSEPNDPDAKSSIFWDSYDLHLSRRMLDNSVHWQQDWDVKEQNELQGIEDRLKYTEAILKEEETALREEQALEVLLREEQQPMDCIFNGDVNKGNYLQNQDIQKTMQNNSVTRTNQLSSTPNVNIAHRCTSLDSSSQPSNYFPVDSVMKLESCELGMSDRIIKECCELGYHDAVRNDCPFNISNKRLSFLSLLRRRETRSRAQKLSHT